MENITLNTTRKVMKAIEIYNGPMDASNLISAVATHTLETPQTITKIIEFLSEIKGTQTFVITPSEPPPSALPPQVIDDVPLNLMDELTYNYKIAKMVLQTSLAENRTTDAEETRKSLRTVSNFMEQALKLQERLYNTQQMQKFQDTVLDTIAAIDPVYRDVIIERLLNE